MNLLDDRISEDSNMEQEQVLDGYYQQPMSTRLLSYVRF